MEFHKRFHVGNVGIVGVPCHLTCQILVIFFYGFEFLMTAFKIKKIP